MKAKRLPQEGIVLEVIENLHEVIWAKIASGVKKFIKEFIENLLTEEVTDRIGAGPYEWSTRRQGIEMDTTSATCLPGSAPSKLSRCLAWTRAAWSSPF